MNQLSYQQETVMRQVEHELTALREFSGRLRGRIMLVCTASAAIVGIVTAARFLPPQTFGGVESLLLSLVCISSVVLYWFAADSLMPAETPLRGFNDTDVLYDEYLSKSEEVAYNNFLIDACQANDKAYQINQRHGVALRRVIWAFKAQVVLLAIAVMLPFVESIAGWPG